MLPIKEMKPLVSGALPFAVPTRVDKETPVTPRFRQDWQRAQEWQKLIEYRLIEWRCNPSQLDEEGTVTPSRETIQLAIDLATLMSKAVLPAPTRIVPDAEGGIVFERQEKGVFESIRISADGSMEHRVFENCRLVFREPWSPFGVNRGIC